MKHYFWSIIFYYFKEDKNTTGMAKKICEVYGDRAVTDKTCPKWFVNFLGAIDISAKFLSVGLSYALEDV